jgi:hypothetical protein
MVDLEVGAALGDGVIVQDALGEQAFQACILASSSRRRRTSEVVVSA